MASCSPKPEPPSSRSGLGVLEARRLILTRIVRGGAVAVALVRAVVLAAGGVSPSSSSSSSPFSVAGVPVFAVAAVVVRTLIPAVRRVGRRERMSSSVAGGVPGSAAPSGHRRGREARWAPGWSRGCFGFEVDVAEVDGPGSATGGLLRRASAGASPAASAGAADSEGPIAAAPPVLGGDAVRQIRARAWLWRRRCCASSPPLPCCPASACFTTGPTTSHTASLARSPRSPSFTIRSVSFRASSESSMPASCRVAWASSRALATSPAHGRKAGAGLPVMVSISTRPVTLSRCRRCCRP